METRHGDIWGVFDDRADAEQTRNELLSSGFRTDEVEIRAPDGPFAADPMLPGLRIRGDAALGALLGCIAGCLIGTLAAPSAHPILGAIVGLIGGAILGGLIAWAIAADRYSFFAQEMQAGQCAVIVHRHDRTEETASALRRHGAARIIGLPESLIGHRV